MHSFRRFLFLWFIGLSVVLVIAVIVLLREFYHQAPVVKIALVEARVQRPADTGGGRTCVCHVIIDNQSDDELSVAYHSVPYDGLRLILWHGDLNVLEQPYSPAPSSAPLRALYFTLPPGRTRATLEFPVELPAGLREGLSAQIMGSLPRSRFEGTLESNAVRIHWPVTD